MKAYQKWALSLGIAAVTPGITMAGPFSIFNRSTQAARPAAAVDNQKLAEAVAQKLRVAKLAGFDIEIEVREGVCQLMGRIKDADQKQRASVVASQVAGITRIDNRLELINGQPAAASSQELPVARSKPGPAPIQTVQNPQPQRRVNLAGFFSRDSKPSAAINEQQVANRIAGAIGQSGVRGHSIDLKYKQGVAILSGVCGSRRDVARITEVVSQVPGVRQVDNRLQVAGMRPVSAPFTSIPAGPAVQQNSSGLPAGGNQAIAEQIAQALAANHLGGLDIEVRYNSGVCTLGGAVKHPQQAAWAAHVAQQVPGVQKIDNRLAVAAAPPIQPASFQQPGQPAGFQGGPPMVTPPMPGPAMNGQGHGGAGPSHLAYDLPNLPNYAWPSYASYPNSAQISYPTEYSASAWPYIGPFYPYPQVPMGWRDVRLSRDDGHWSLAFNSRTDKWFWFLDPKNW
ncbi:MAG: BON domain-containing protein [Planctomycetaceae bacterium]